MKVRAWVRIGLELIWGSFGFGAALMIFQLLNLDGEFDLSSLSLFPLYFLFGCAVFEMIMNLSVYRSYMPMCLSFGSTRKDVKRGIHIMTLLPSAAVVLICAVYCLLLRNDITASILKILPAAFFLLIFLGALCSAAGCLSTKYRVGKWLVFIVTILCSGAAGFCAAYSITDIGASSFSAPWMMTAAAAAAALVMTAAELAVQNRLVGSYEVKL